MSLREELQKTLGSSYILDRELGGGGMSRVFIARDTQLRREVVVKVLPPELVAGVNVERFRREILVAAGLQHPHIVPVLASGESNGLPWFSMPFVQGESLRDRLARGPLPIADAIGVLREVAKALAYAHERGVVHRDIKPDNVLITGGTAVVTDFGIAKALSASRASPEDATATRGSLTQVGTSIGTPMYMAPEQAAADPNTDARADLYSFGCMAYELLAGRPPFVGMSPQKLLASHMGERPQNVSELRPDTPPLVRDLVMQCLEKDPDGRPASAADVVCVLDAATSSGSTEVASAVLLGGRVSAGVALVVWALAFGAAWILAKAAIVGIGLPNWVLPGALIVAGLGLPAILFTAFVQRTARDVMTRTPTLTPGGSPAPPGTMATIAVKASRHVSWKRTVRAGVVAFGTFVVIVALFMGMRAAGIGPAGSLLASGRMRVKEPLLVTDFTVRSGDSTLAGVVSEAARSSLSQSSAISLVTPAAVAATLGLMQLPATSRIDLALARRIGQRDGIRAIIDGDVAQLGTGYAITIRLVTADSGTSLATAQRVVDGPKELIAAVDAMTRELRGRIGESLRSVQNAPPLDKVTTASIEALRLYSEASRAYNLRGDFDGSIKLFQQAIAIDSGFAMAWRRLGSVYSAAGYPTADVENALERAYHLRDRLSVRERLITEATYFSYGPGTDRAKSAAASDRLLAGGDSDVSTLINDAIIATTRRQYPRADSLLAAALRTGPSQAASVDLVIAQIDAGQIATARASANTALHLYQTPGAKALALSIAAMIDASVGDFEASQRLVDSLVAHAPVASRRYALETRAAIRAIRGRLGELSAAMSAIHAGASQLGASTIPLDDSILLSTIDVTAAEQPVRALRRLSAALAATPLHSLALADRDYFGVASIYARAGQPDKAKAVLAERAGAVRDSARLRSQEPSLHRTLGEIAIAEHRPRDAVREFWRGDSLPDGPFDDCDACTFINVARAYDKATEPDSAAVYFEKFFASTAFRRTQIDMSTRAPAARRLGELYEAKGDRGKAAHYYQMFVELWKNADPELQPQVTEIRKRLARLSDTERK